MMYRAVSTLTTKPNLVKNIDGRSDVRIITNYFVTIGLRCINPLVNAYYQNVRSETVCSPLWKTFLTLWRYITANKAYYKASQRLLLRRLSINSKHDWTVEVFKITRLYCSTYIIITSTLHCKQRHCCWN